MNTTEALEAGDCSVSDGIGPCGHPVLTSEVKVKVLNRRNDHLAGTCESYEGLVIIEYKGARSADIGEHLKVELLADNWDLGLRPGLRFSWQLNQRSRPFSVRRVEDPDAFVAVSMSPNLVAELGW